MNTLGFLLVMNNLSIIHQWMGDLPKALEYATDVLEEVTDRGDRRSEVQIRLNIASILSTQCDYDAAHGHYRIVFGILDEEDDPHLRASALAERCFHLAEEGQVASQKVVVRSIGSGSFPWKPSKHHLLDFLMRAVCLCHCLILPHQSQCLLSVSVQPVCLEAAVVGRQFRLELSDLGQCKLDSLGCLIRMGGPRDQTVRDSSFYPTGLP